MSGKYKSLAFMATKVEYSRYYLLLSVSVARLPIVSVFLICLDVICQFVQCVKVQYGEPIYHIILQAQSIKRFKTGKGF